MAYKCRALTADVMGSFGIEGEDELAWIRTGHALCMDKLGKMLYMFGGQAVAGLRYTSVLLGSVLGNSSAPVCEGPCSQHMA